MWGRITQIAEKLDDTFATEAGADDDEDDFSPSNISSQNDGDGWDETDDLNDEDLNFSDEWGGGDDDGEDDDDADLTPPEEEVLRENYQAASDLENGETTHDDVNGHVDVPNTVSGEDAPSSTMAIDDDNDRVVTVSAPGKALIAGGYLVLESPNPGVVIAAKGCKFHCTVAFQPTFGVVPAATDVVDSTADVLPFDSRISVDVYSPQFNQVYTYILMYSQCKTDLRLELRKNNDESTASSTISRNKFIERTLLLCFGYLRMALGDQFRRSLQKCCGVQPNASSLAIKLRADNDFYSQLARFRERGLDPTPQNVHKLEPFLCPIDKANGSTAVNKTGLGSSAALVTSMVGSLLQFFGVVSLPNSRNECKESDDGLRKSHNLAQICHCYAQGKVGSGFDVSSAVYGSHVYTRFSKGIIKSLLEEVDKINDADFEWLQLSASMAIELFDLVNDESNRWDCTVVPFTLPKGLEIIMADICGGSESPSMARKVLEWKKNCRGVGFLDDYFWKSLKRCNNKIASLLTKDFASAPVVDGLDRDGTLILANRTAEQWKKPMPSTWHEFEGSSWFVAGKLLDLRIALLESRQNLKGMGKAANVPIEPDNQTKLANATMKLPGVIAAGVPGAGGYDALFVLYVKGEETADGISDKVRDEIGDLWKTLSDTDDEAVVCPLNARAAGYGGENGLSVTDLGW